MPPPLAAVGAAWRLPRARIRVPARPMRAGTRVSAESIVTTTTMAEAAPMAPTKGTPDRYRPRIAMTTVLPATTIAAPDVDSARPIDTTGSIPASS